MAGMPGPRRGEEVAALASTTFDVVVIGAGMTGAGVAVDAAARGLSVALLDKGDLGSGTSSKSSKMVHGGLRYLQQREFRLVYENLHERQRLLENAPYLVSPLPFLIPLFGSNGVASKTLVRGYASALRLYDLSGGWRIGHRHTRVTRDDVLAHFPTMRTDRLVAGFLYYDARGDDARVALVLARTAQRYGARVANYVRATGITKDHRGRVEAVTARDEVAGQDLTIATRSVINATGVWADDVFAMTEGRPSRRVTPAKGVHVTVPRDRLPADVAAVLAVPGDRRSVFVVPFEDDPFTYVGTTDTPYDGPLDDPDATAEDVDYLLAAVNASTSSDLRRADVTGVWAGLRPLLAPSPGRRVSERTADLSRRHQVIDAGDGVVHVTGGKWTTYRKMAQDAVDALRGSLGPLAASRTRRLALYGVDDWRPTTPEETRLFHRYGADAPRVLALARERPDLAERPVNGLAYLGAEYLFAARDEMATSLEDLLCRRTRAHLIDARAARAGAERVARLVAAELGWDEARVAREVAAYRALVARELACAGLEP
ncbi:MAG TPA: glycerol-3-phosphate dehydrogenase/oxidase [Acidimicrobiales bacterium]|nr:glycerol-3-phosphate dehydrogenase/oxidase [Acidimicrobiales bacterium]